MKYATVWMNMGNILSDRNMSQRTHIVSFILYVKSRVGKSIETKRKLVDAKWAGGFLGVMVVLGN